MTGNVPAMGAALGREEIQAALRGQAAADPVLVTRVQRVAQAGLDDRAQLADRNRFSGRLGVARVGEEQLGVDPQACRVLAPPAVCRSHEPWSLTFVLARH